MYVLVSSDVGIWRFTLVSSLSIPGSMRNEDVHESYSCSWPTFALGFDAFQSVWLQCLGSGRGSYQSSLWSPQRRDDGDESWMPSSSSGSHTCPRAVRVNAPWWVMANQSVSSTRPCSFRSAHLRRHGPRLVPVFPIWKDLVQEVPVSIFRFDVSPLSCVPPSPCMDELRSAISVGLSPT